MASSSSNKGADKYESHSPLPPALSPPGESEKACVPTKKTSDRKLLPMARRGYGSKGQNIQLQTNHFKVSMDKKDGFFYHYTVALFYEDKRPVEAKGIGRRVLDKVYETYASELQCKSFAYDGEKALFTITSLPRNKFEFDVVLDEISSNKVGRTGSPDNTEATDKKRMRRPYQSKTFKVEISYANKIPMQEIVDALSGIVSDHHQEAFRVLDIILRQHAAKQGCLLVRQSFFHDRVENYKDIGGGVQGCRGFHSSFRATQGDLSLNVDVSTTLLLKPGPVLDFLCTNQDVKHPRFIDWTKAKRMLKNLRIKVNNMEQKITGLSDKPCKDQTFSLKQGRDANGEVKSTEITVSDYFEHHKGIRLLDSANLPCINAGKPKKPSYFPIELCTLVSLQRYTKALTSMQRASLVEVSRQKPRDRMTSLSNSLRNSRYNDDPMLRSSGITIDSEFTKVEGRVLPAPKLKVGREEDILPRNGRWNFNNKHLFQPMVIDRWAIVNFSARCNIKYLIEGLKKCAHAKGMDLKDPFNVLNENEHMSRKPPTVRVEELYATLMKQLPGQPQFLLCILSEKKNSDIYGPWKRINLAADGKGGGVITQCIAPTKMNDQYFTNVLLKINVKLGGMNSFLAIESSLSIPMVSQVPTLILGMDVSHGSPGRSDVPSIAAVVSSRCWPQVSRYRALVRAQSPKVEMIANLFNFVSDTKDDGIFRELLDDFTDTSGMRPEHIVIFRDGVSESQFNQVLNIELHQIMQACKHFQESWDPKFTVIIAQKNHHTKFFQANAQENVPPGTVIDSRICHPKNNDFYMCAHAGMIGTSRPTHYHVLHDEIGFSADGLQELVHSLCYVYQRSTTAISVVAPICYAHLAATQVAQFIKFDEFSESCSSHGGLTSVGTPQVQELPRLDEKVRNSMFFC